MTYRIKVWVLILVALPWVASAHPLHPIKVRKEDPPARFSFQKQTIAIEVSAMGNIWLVDRKLETLWKEDPVAALWSMRQDPRMQRDRQAVLGLAELEGTAGFRLRKKDPVQAMGLFLRSATTARRVLKDTKLKPHFEPADRREIQALCIHNEAVAEALRLLRDEVVKQAVGRRLPTLLEESELLVEFHADGDLQIADLERLELCADYEVSGLSMYSRAGLGTTAFLIETKGEGDHERWFPPHRPVLWTAWIELVEASDRRTHAYLRVVNPLALTRQAGREIPVNLAEDLTTPLAYMIDQSPMSKLKRLGLLRPDEVPEATGLFTLTPYQPGRIPVVFVHGLYSSPGAFAEMYNTLMANPEIRKRCHLFFFQYPTGNPFLYSTHNLRLLLRELYEDYSYGNQNSAFRQMMVVGHSMGGILTKMQVVDSGPKIWEQISDRPLEEVEPDPTEQERLRDLLFFESQPFIRRVVFLATPHQGSELAASMLARAGARMIRLPSDLVSLHQTLALDLNPMGIGRAKGRTPTSIDDLAPHSPILQVLAKLEKNPEVTCHSVIGNLLPGPVAVGTDGVVPYRSAHIDDVESELVIRSSHSCERHPDAIKEVQRILFIHLESSKGTGADHLLAQ